MSNSLKNIVRSLSNTFGFDIEKSPTGFGVKYQDAPGWRPGYLKSLCSPTTVLDVGVGYGTPVLYESFPLARFGLFEPLREYDSAIADLLTHLDGKHYPFAIGGDNGTITINVDPKELQRSSINSRSRLTQTGSSLESRDIEIKRLDAFLDDEFLKPPFLLKIDTEGFEHEVLRGASKTLESTEVIISEVSVAQRFEGSYNFFEFMSLINDANFQLCNILFVGQQPGRVDAGYIDAVFRRVNQ